MFENYSQLRFSLTFNSTSPEKTVTTLQERFPSPVETQSARILDEYAQRFNAKVVEKSHSLINSHIGAKNFVSQIVSEFKDEVIQPIGARTFGATILSYKPEEGIEQLMKSLQKIKPGDILVIRKAKFEAHKRSEKTKLSTLEWTPPLRIRVLLLIMILQRISLELSKITRERLFKTATS